VRLRRLDVCSSCSSCVFLTDIISCQLPPNSSCCCLSASIAHSVPVCRRRRSTLPVSCLHDSLHHAFKNSAWQERRWAAMMGRESGNRGLRVNGFCYPTRPVAKSVTRPDPYPWTNYLPDPNPRVQVGSGTGVPQTEQSLADIRSRILTPFVV